MTGVDDYRAELERLASEYAGRLAERDADIVGRYLRDEKQSDIGKLYDLGQAAVSNLLSSLRESLDAYENMPRADLRAVLDKELEPLDVDLIEAMAATGNQTRVAKWLTKKYPNHRPITQTIVRHRFFKIKNSLKGSTDEAHKNCAELLNWVANHQYVLQRLEPPTKFRSVKTGIDYLAGTVPIEKRESLE